MDFYLALYDLFLLYEVLGTPAILIDNDAEP